MTNFKQEIISSYEKSVEETCRLLMLVPVDVDKMNFQLTPDSLVLHELIRHIQQFEFYAVRGLVTEEWQLENIPWYVGKNIPMCDQLKTNHRTAMKFLETIPEEEFFTRMVKTENVEASLASSLMFYLDRMHHYRTLLFETLKMLGIKITDKDIWEQN